jgi:hypothetical protein
MAFQIKPVLKMEKNGFHKIQGIRRIVKNSPRNGILNGQSQEKKKRSRYQQPNLKEHNRL